MSNEEELPTTALKHVYEVQNQRTVSLWRNREQAPDNPRGELHELVRRKDVIDLVETLIRFGETELDREEIDNEFQRGHIKALELVLENLGVEKKSSNSDSRLSEEYEGMSGHEIVENVKEKNAEDDNR